MDISSVIQQDFISIGKKEQRKVYKGRKDNNRWEKQTRQRANRDVIDNDNEMERERLIKRDQMSPGRSEK